MSIASILSDLWRGGGGGAFEASLRAQELQKGPGRIGLKQSCTRTTLEANIGRETNCFRHFVQYSK